MNPDHEFSLWHRIARVLLEPQDVARIIEPTLADALYERNSTNRRHAWLWRNRVALLSAILAALTGSVCARLRHAHWQGFLFLALSGLSGAAVLSRGDHRQFALTHILFLGIAVTVGAAVVCVPRALLRHLGTAAMFFGFVGLAVCPWWGEAHAGQRQWLRLWDLQIHIATLALPAFVVFMARCLRMKRYNWLSVGVVVTIALVILEDNVEATVVYIATVAATLLRLRGTLRSWILTTVLISGALVALVTDPDATLWSWLGTAALLFALAHSVRSSQSGPLDATRQAVPVALVSLTALRGFGDGTVPIVGFGGSAIVAFFVLMALQMRDQTQTWAGSSSTS